MVKIAVIGAGITGLAFSNQVNDTSDVTVFEGKGHIGGKCYSYSKDTKVGTFSFDIGGHFLHTRSFVEVADLFKGLREFKRSAYVQMLDQLIMYPIQSFYGQLTQQEYVGNIDKELAEIREKGIQHYSNYDEMLRMSYGETLYQLFFKNYNQKVFGAEDLSTLYTSGLEQKRNVRLNNDKGYNDSFMYFDNGRGIHQLVQQLADGIDIQLSKQLTKVNLAEKRIKFQDDQEFVYDLLVSTIPLNKLVGLCDEVDSSIREASGTLRSSKGYIMNFGIKNNQVHAGKTWVYYPEETLPFYRVGIYSNVDKLMSPEGYSSIYVECVWNANYEDVVESLIKTKFIDSREDIICHDIHVLDENYCFNSPSTLEILEWLKARNVYSIGRYGSWRWSSMHEDIKQAHELANTLLIQGGLYSEHFA